MSKHGQDSQVVLLSLKALYLPFFFCHLDLCQSIFSLFLCFSCSCVSFRGVTCAQPGVDAARLQSIFDKRLRELQEEEQEKQVCPMSHFRVSL